MCFNLYNSIPVNVNPADGYSSGQAQQAIKEVAAQLLLTDYGYEYGGMAREEAASGGAQWGREEAHETKKHRRIVLFPNKQQRIYLGGY